MRRTDDTSPRAEHARQKAKERARRYRARKAAGITLPKHEPLNPDQRRKRNRIEARDYRARVRAGVKVPKRIHPVPDLVAWEVDGHGGYWRAVHANGLVQIVQGNRARALREVRKQVARLNEFERWARAHYAKERLALL